MSKNYFVYVLKSKNRPYLYVGMTDNPPRRIKQHNEGKERTTRAYRPFEIIIIEKFSFRKEAREREKYLKSGIGKEYLKKLVKEGPSWRNWQTR